MGQGQINKSDKIIQKKNNKKTLATFKFEAKNYILFKTFPIGKILQ